MGLLPHPTTGQPCLCVVTGLLLTSSRKLSRWNVAYVQAHNPSRPEGFPSTAALYPIEVGLRRA